MLNFENLFSFDVGFVEQTTHGTFNPFGHEDILDVAIGRPEHPRRVRVTGYGVGIQSYFGPSSHRKEHSFSQPSQEHLLQLWQQIKDEKTQEIRESLMGEFNKGMNREFEKRWEGLGLSQKPPTIVQDNPPPIKRVNTKGSCLAVDLSGDDFGSNSQCELYVDYDSSTRFVALVKCMKGSQCYTMSLFLLI